MLQYIGFSSTMNGILTTMFIVTSPLNPNTVIQEMRNWKSEQERTPVEEMLNNSLQELEWGDYGSDGSTESEELLQFPSNGDSEGSGRRYDRCSDRSLIRFIQERTGKNCGSGHPRVENERFGGKSPWD